MFIQLISGLFSLTEKKKKKVLSLWKTDLKKKIKSEFQNSTKIHEINSQIASRKDERSYEVSRNLFLLSIVHK